VVIDEDNITKVFLPLDNMMEIMDAHTMDLMNMRSQGKNVEFFLGQVNEWREKLNKVDAVVNEWLKVQKNWRMLVNIFLKSEDIKQQLANETQIFKDVDKEFREMMDLVYM
jgi:dynein heavy chain